MKLLIVFTAILAFTFAEEEKSEVSSNIEDSEAAASSIEILTDGADLVKAASSYVPPNFVNHQYITQRPIQPLNTWVQPTQPPVQNNYHWGNTGSHHDHYTTQAPVQHDYQWGNTGSNHVHHTTQASVQNDYHWVSTGSHHGHHTTQPPVKNDYHWGNTGNHHHHQTTPQVAVIKNEIYYGDNGDYKYEYKTADGTHVGEQGWFTDPKHTDESLVKKGWYSFVGADGITYTVTYWADHTGYHASGAHLPSNRPHYPTQTQTPYPVQSTTLAPTYPHKPSYTTARPTYTLKPLYPTYQTQKPSFYPTQQQTYDPHQQQGYNQPQQHVYNPHYNV